MRTFAEIGPGSVVLRVIVGTDLLSIAQLCGGFWVETIRGHSIERYAGKGMIYIPGDPRQFVSEGE